MKNSIWQSPSFLFFHWLQFKIQLAAGVLLYPVLLHICPSILTLRMIKIGYWKQNQHCPVYLSIWKPGSCIYFPQYITPPSMTLLCSTSLLWNEITAEILWGSKTSCLFPHFLYFSLNRFFGLCAGIAWAGKKKKKVSEEGERDHVWGRRLPARKMEYCDWKATRESFLLILLTALLT